MKEKKRGSRPVNNPIFFFLSKCKVCQRMCGIGCASLPVLLSLYQVLDSNMSFLSINVQIRASFLEI